MPLRAIFTSLGADIEWDAATSTVAATRGGSEVVCKSTTPSPSSNGATVGWDEATRTVMIESP
ncbi:stalk domain-containing protein [Paenibacillus sp.]|uniref:stalk domain-containing protein n=1 Tax=Paenibacillus sp. TaxID=58172 RepID=UPI0039C9D072